jgi:hypothetical protein
MRNGTLLRNLFFLAVGQAIFATGIAGLGLPLESRDVAKTGRVERRRDRFRPLASCVSALSSFVANGHQVLPTFPPPPLFIPYGEFSPVRLEASLVAPGPSAAVPGGV